MKRIENRDLLDQYQKMPCENCGSRKGVSAHHVHAKKSGGHDIECNLIPLCFDCHRSCHDKGRTTFAKENYPVFNWLNLNGWEFNEITNKWFNPNAHT